jgi:hypothetical protein
MPSSSRASIRSTSAGVAGSFHRAAFWLAWKTSSALGASPDADRAGSGTPSTTCSRAIAHEAA